MSTDDRPSIAELQRRFDENPTDEQPAMPVLLEIAAAALAYEDAQCDATDCEHPAHRAGCAIRKAGHRMREALTRVRA